MRSFLAFTQLFKSTVCEALPSGAIGAIFAFNVFLVALSAHAQVKITIKKSALSDLLRYDGSLITKIDLNTASRASFSGYKNILSCLSFPQIADIVTYTGSIDVSSTIAACETAAGPNLAWIWPAGKYQLSSTTIVPPAGVSNVGTAISFNGSTELFIPSGTTVPTFKSIAGANAFKGMAFVSQTYAAGQWCIYVNNANNVTIAQNFFYGCEAQVYLDGQSFYTSIFDNLFNGGTKYNIWVNSTEPSGVDLMLRNNRYLGLSQPQISAWRFDGLGSLISHGDLMSAANTGGPLMYFSTPAPLFGGAQIDACVAEQGNSTQPALYINGTSTQPWNKVHFDDCFMVSSYTMAVVLGYSNHAVFHAGSYASGATGGHAFVIGSYGISNDLELSSVDLQGDAGSPPFYAAVNSKVNGTILDTTWGGTSALADISQVPPSGVAYFRVLWGNPGQASVPVLFQAGTPVSIINDKFNLKPAVTVASVPACGPLTIGNKIQVTDLTAAPTYRSALPSSGGGTFYGSFECNGASYEAH